MPFDILKGLLRSRSKPAPRSAARDASDGFVAFVTSVPAPCFLDSGERLESDQASVRLRVDIPAREIARRARVCLVPPDYLRVDPGLVKLGTPRAVVVGKFPVSFYSDAAPQAAALLDWVETAARSRRVLVDFSDDLGAAAQMYSRPALGEIQKRLLNACAATVPTATLRERLLADARHGVTVIEDPYESPSAAQPRFAPGATLRLAWFGVFGPPLRPLIESAFAAIARRLAPRPVDITFVTYANQAALVGEMALALRAVHPEFRVRHVEWSLRARADAIAGADLVVLPQDAASMWGTVKSHNRLVEAIRGGRFAIAPPVPAYVELSEYSRIGDDLANAIEWALGHPDEVLSRLDAGQAYVAQRFSPERIGAQWARVLGL